MIAARATAALAALACAGSAGAVGLGPLTHSGTTRSEQKGFYLTLINPYPERERFRLYAVGWDDERPDPRVRIPRAERALGARTQQKVLVIATGLAPGEEHGFRVCAQKTGTDTGEMIDARVCSRLTARRLP